MIIKSKQAQLHIGLLRGFHLRLADGGSISLPTRKAEALVAYLACGQRPFPRETLTALFWPDRDPQQAAANLHKILSTLRRSQAITRFPRCDNGLAVARKRRGAGHDQSPQIVV